VLQSFIASGVRPNEANKLKHVLP